MRRLFGFVIAISALCSGSLEAQVASEGTIANADSTVIVQSAPVTDSGAAVLVAAHPVGSYRTRFSTNTIPDLRLADERFDASRLLPQDTTRRKSVTYGDWYARRLRIHRYGSYAMLPLFVTQYVLGDKLLKQKDAQYAGTRLTPIDKSLRNTHVAVASTVGVLFVVNTTTGLWNLFESRHTIEGRKLRTLHALTMLAADAGFLYTGSISKNAVDHGPSEARKHRNAALVSFGISTAGASLMWFRRD